MRRKDKISSKFVEGWTRLGFLAEKVADSDMPNLERKKTVSLNFKREERYKAFIIVRFALPRLKKIPLLPLSSYNGSL